MAKQSKSRRYTVAFIVMMTCSCIYHYIPVEPPPTKTAEVVIDCKDRYLNTITAVRNSDGSGYSYSYTCSDYPPVNVKLLIKE